MGDNQLPKNDFIREQIKDKPFNKRRAVFQVGLSALCGLVFAMTACVVAILFFPQLRDGRGQITETEHTDTQQENVKETESTTEVSQQAVSEDTFLKELEKDDQQLSLKEYQKVQDELYRIGNEADKAIVSVTSVVSDTDWFHNLYEREDQGSGVIIADQREELLILTERRIISDASRISVTFIDNSSAEAVLKKYDGNTGLAILSVEKEGLSQTTRNRISVAAMGNSHSVRNGEIVIALGSPLGINRTMLFGSITSTENEISTKDTNYRIFTTNILAGKNGSGILVNTNGQMIGIVAQEYSAAGAGNSLTVIAISDVKPMLDLLSDGKDMPYLGMYVSTVTGQIAQENEIPEGIYVREVEVDSPAMLAGIQSGDIITSVNGVEVSSVESMRIQLLSMLPGETYKISAKRQGSSGYSSIKFQVEAGVLE